MMMEWRERRPAHVLKSCTVQPLSVIVDEIYLPLLTHEVRAMVCQDSYPRDSENMLFVLFPCLIIVVRGSGTHETKVWFWSSRQLSDPRNVCRRLEFSLSSPVRCDSASSRSWSIRRCCLRALFLAVAFRGSVTAFSAANPLIMDSSALCWAEATLSHRKSRL